MAICQDELLQGDQLTDAFGQHRNVGAPNVEVFKVVEIDNGFDLLVHVQFLAIVEVQFLEVQLAKPFGEQSQGFSVLMLILRGVG